MIVIFYVLLTSTICGRNEFRPQITSKLKYGSIMRFIANLVKIVVILVS